MSDSGQMDIRPNQEMWKIFMRLTVWITAGIVVLLILMAIFLL